MKLLKKLGIIITVSSLLIITPMVTSTNISVYAATISINKKAPKLTVGATVQLKLNGTKSKVKWSSKDKTIATVDKNGKVEAMASGTTTISAKIGDKNYTSTVTVKNISYKSKLHYLCLEEILELELKDCEAPVKWESEDESIATVDDNGTITSKAVGKTVINAVVNGVKYPYKITVEDPKIQDVTVKEGEDLYFSEILTGTERKDIWWEFSNLWVIYDTHNGEKISGSIRGESTATAHFGAGTKGKTMSCKITVN